MNRDGTFWNWVPWTLFIFMICIATGQYWRIVQVEPQLITAQAEIKRTNRLMAEDLADMDVLITLLEKKIHGGRLKK